MSTERSDEVLRHWLSTGFYILTTEIKVSTARFWPRSCASLLQEQFKNKTKNPRGKRMGRALLLEPRCLSHWPSDDLPGSNPSRWHSNNQLLTSATMKPQLVNTPLIYKPNSWIQKGCLLTVHEKKQLHFAVSCPSYQCVMWCPHLSEAYLRSVLPISNTELASSTVSVIANISQNHTFLKRAAVNTQVGKKFCTITLGSTIKRNFFSVTKQNIHKNAYTYISALEKKHRNIQLR